MKISSKSYWKWTCQFLSMLWPTPTRCSWWSWTIKYRVAPYSRELCKQSRPDRIRGVCMRYPTIIHFVSLHQPSKMEVCYWRGLKWYQGSSNDLINFKSWQWSSHQTKLRSFVSLWTIKALDLPQHQRREHWLGSTTLRRAVSLWGSSGEAPSTQSSTTCHSTWCRSMSPAAHTKQKYIFSR